MIEEILTGASREEIIASGILGGLVGLGIFLLLVISLGVYVYFAFALQTIGKKLHYKKSWLAWIPIAQWAMMLQLGRFHWAWIFLILLPVFGWIALFVLLIIASWRIFQDRNYPGWFSLGILIPEVGALLYLVAIGFVAWKDNPKITPMHQAPPSREKTRSAKKTTNKSSPKRSATKKKTSKRK